MADRDQRHARRQAADADGANLVPDNGSRACLGNPLPRTGWRVKVDGDLPLDVSIRFAWDTPEQGARHGYGNANRPINAVPNVCEAPPGILSTFALPQIVSKLR